MNTVDLAAAQQRVLLRQRLRAARALAAREAQRTRYASTFLVRAPAPLRPLTWKGFEAWELIKGHGGTKPAFRVGQVDAELLDEELLHLLRGQVGDGLRLLGSHLLDEWAPEILLGLRAVLFKLSVWDHDASYGATLQGLSYTDARIRSSRSPPTRGQKALYGLFSVGGRYAWTKWEDWLIEKEGGYDEPTPQIQTLARLTSHLSTAHTALSLLSFTAFLLDGRHRTLLDRLLRLRLTPPARPHARQVSFEYLNRQLVWHAFTEFLLFMLPLVGIRRWRGWIARAWRSGRRMVRSGDAEDEKKGRGGGGGGELAFLPERTCAICYLDQNAAAAAVAAPGDGQALAVGGGVLGAGAGGVVGSAATDVTNPYAARPCGCVYCYVCVATRVEVEAGEGGPGWTCLRCGEIVQACGPWAGDVLVPKENVAEEGEGKSVKFVDVEDDGQGGEMGDVGGFGDEDEDEDEEELPEFIFTNAE